MVMDCTKIKSTLKILEQDITKLKKKIKRFQREGNYSQIGWRKKLLTNRRKKATLIYKVLEANNNLKKEWYLL